MRFMGTALRDKRVLKCDLLVLPCDKWVLVCDKWVQLGILESLVIVEILHSWYFAYRTYPPEAPE